MTTVRDICYRALRRLRVNDVLETPSSQDAATALYALNDMMHEWRSMGVNVVHQDFTLSSTFVFFVPPLALVSSVLPSLTCQGLWDASANSPSLASATGTEGYLYRVSVAATRTLDDVLTWAVDDYAVYDGDAWFKSQTSTQFNGAVTAMLAVRLSSEFGAEPDAVTVRDAGKGWFRIHAQFVRPDNASFDLALLDQRGRFIWNAYDGS